MVLLFAFASANGQVNYVLNPSFEEHTGCPFENDQLWMATYWGPIDTVATHPLCSAEYINACGGPTWPWGVPGNGNLSYYQYPRHGNGMAEGLMFSDESSPTSTVYYKRDYIQGRFSQPLTAGQSYCVTFYTVAVNQTPYAHDQIGAYIDNGAIDTFTVDTFACASPQTQYTPQVVCNGIISDTQNWVKVEGSFIANGTERFITIGNFKDKANTNVIALNDTTGITQGGGWSYYLFDDVSVVPSDLDAYAGNDTTINQGDSAFIGRSDLLPDIKWRDGNGIIDSLNAGIWVHPIQTTTYTVEQTLCGLVKYDTVTITVIPQDTTIDTPESVPYIAYKAGFSLYPNPSNGDIIAYSSLLANSNVDMLIADVSGLIMLRDKIVFKGTYANLHVNLIPGVYLMELRNKSGGKYLQRLIIK